MIPRHLAFLKDLGRNRVDYVLIGLLGINHYAPGYDAAFITQDADVHIDPKTGSLRKAVRLLRRHGYHVEAGGEPLVGEDPYILRRIVELRALVRGRQEGQLQVDLVLEAAPYSFAQWRKARRLCRVKGGTVSVGKLDMLLEAKRRAGRPKDKAFLTMYEAHRKTRELEAKEDRARGALRPSRRAGAGAPGRRARR